MLSQQARRSMPLRLGSKTAQEAIEAHLKTNAIKFADQTGDAEEGALEGAPSELADDERPPDLPQPTLQVKRRTCSRTSCRT